MSTHSIAMAKGPIIGSFHYQEHALMHHVSCEFACEVCPETISVNVLKGETGRRSSVKGAPCLLSNGVLGSRMYNRKSESFLDQDCRKPNYTSGSYKPSKPILRSTSVPLINLYRRDVLV